MFCKRCGTELKDGVKFCPECGEKVEPAVNAEVPVTGEIAVNTEPAKRPEAPAGMPLQSAPGITKGEDGVYRWTYSMNLFRNPTILILVWKIFFFVLLGIFVFMTVIGLIERYSPPGELLLQNLKFFGIFVGGMTALVGVSYLIYAAIMGGKYIVEFEMDEKGVLHRQVEAQAKKARGIAAATAIIGAAAGQRGTVSASMAAARTEMYSEFSKVRKVKAYKHRRLIKVTELLEHNQVYASKEDFDFVYGYIVAHCERINGKTDK